MQGEGRCILGATVAKYNESCKGKADGEFGAARQDPGPLGEGAVLCDEDLPGYVQHPGRAQAQREVPGPRRIAGRPIPRLYSGGEMGSFFGWMYNGGGNNAEALVTGKIAGANAAKEKPWGEDGFRPICGVCC